MVFEMTDSVIVFAIFFVIVHEQDQGKDANFKESWDQTLQGVFLKRVFTGIIVVFFVHVF